MEAVRRLLELPLEVWRRAERLGRDVASAVADFAYETLRRHVELLRMASDALAAYARAVAGRPHVITIRGVKYMSVSKSDLEQIADRVAFESIDELKFEDDVDNETFRAKVDYIRDVRKLSIPKTLSRLLVYSRCANVSEVEVRS